MTVESHHDLPLSPRERMTPAEYLEWLGSDLPPLTPEERAALDAETQRELAALMGPTPAEQLPHTADDDTAAYEREAAMRANLSAVSMRRDAEAEVLRGRAREAAADQRRATEQSLSPNRSNVVALSDALDTAKALFSRRFSGEERPMPLPWPGVAGALGGGLWPGAHVVTGTTAAGKTAFALQVALNAGLAGHPVLYIGLELDTAQIVARLASMAMGENASARVLAHWSDIYLGKKDPRDLDAAIESLRALPIYVEEAPPGGWSARSMRSRVEAIRLKHSDAGYKAPLVVLDFLQLVGPSDAGGRREELRERIGAAAYAGREVARRCSAVVLMLSSISRSGAQELSRLAADAKLGDGDPADLVGLGKESGDIEFSADSVLALAREQRREGTPKDAPAMVWLALAKIRAGVPTWSLLSFNGSWLSEVPPDQRDQHTESRVTARDDARERRAEEKREHDREEGLALVLQTLRAAKDPLSLRCLRTLIPRRKNLVDDGLGEAQNRGLVQHTKLGWIAVPEASVAGVAGCGPSEAGPQVGCGVARGPIGATATHTHPRDAQVARPRATGHATRGRLSPEERQALLALDTSHDEYREALIARAACPDPPAPDPAAEAIRQQVLRESQGPEEEDTDE